MRAVVQWRAGSGRRRASSATPAPPVSPARRGPMPRARPSSSSPAGAIPSPLLGTQGQGRGNSSYNLPHVHKACEDPEDPAFQTSPILTCASTDRCSKLRLTYEGKPPRGR